MSTQGIEVRLFISLLALSLAACGEGAKDGGLDWCEELSKVEQCPLDGTGYGWKRCIDNQWSTCQDIDYCSSAGQMETCQMDCKTWGDKICGTDNIWTECIATETCNNIDDNCDGKIDEPWPKKGSACDGDDDDQCANGAWECDAAGTAVICVGDNSVDETCDNADNDCDGAVDEGLSEQCTCGAETGQRECANGLWGSCSAGEAEPEVCDNQDNNCDGVIDEGFPLNQACAAGVGECETEGVTVCSTDGAATECDAVPSPPKDEACDGLDNDCDGEADEGVEEECTCGEVAGTRACDNGAWGSCSAGEPTEEVCDNLDNDCDGETDEGVSDTCFCGQVEGASQCAQGAWGPCSAGEPVDEVCDNVDNDCDGETDEGFAQDEYEADDTCDMARVLEDIAEDGESLELQANLYKPNLSEDLDWYQITGTELSDVIPPCLPAWDDMCLVFEVTLEGPTETDLDLCVYEWDCLEESEPECETGPGGQETVRIGWKGAWMGDDSKTFLVEVFGKTPEDFSCSNYNLEFDLQSAGCPVDDECIWPWETE